MLRFPRQFLYPVLRHVGRGSLPESGFEVPGTTMIEGESSAKDLFQA